MIDGGGGTYRRRTYKRGRVGKNDICAGKRHTEVGYTEEGHRSNLGLDIGANVLRGAYGRETHGRGT